VNPVLVNDLRKSLFRRKPVLAVAYMAAAILVLTLGAAQFVPVGGSWRRQDLPLWRFPDILLPVLAPAFAAGAFAKEHEQRTWQDVLLTRLRAGEILAGKFTACFIPTLVALVVLCPPLLLILILQGVDWAMEAGPWMLILAAKFVIAVTFYVTVALVCSYHSPNARVALVVGYCALAVYGMANFAAWQFVIEPMMVPSARNYLQWSGSGYGAWGDRQEFVLSQVDWLLLLQSFVLSGGLLTYLGLRLRQRRE
jgi:ABC-type transport system involved in multi-copper enzyme maturation permease subunit